MMVGTVSQLRICGLLAQLFRHVHDYEVPCGVLSGTVTVFVRCVDERVKVSDA